MQPTKDSKQKAKFKQGEEKKKLGQRWKESGQFVERNYIGHDKMDMGLQGIATRSWGLYK